MVRVSAQLLGTFHHVQHSLVRIETPARAMLTRVISTVLASCSDFVFSSLARHCLVTESVDMRLRVCAPFA
jgi:hypothetical protein